jgi:hypothetical protein
MISMVYLYSSYMYYTDMQGFAQVAGGMVAMQFFFVLAVVTSALANLLNAENQVSLLMTW